MHAWYTSEAPQSQQHRQRHKPGNYNVTRGQATDTSACQQTRTADFERG